MSHLVYEFAVANNAVNLDAFLFAALTKKAPVTAGVRFQQEESLALIKLILSVVIGWLLWLGLLILVVQFNKYGWADPPMIDCDTDAEAALALLIWLVWITAALFLLWFYRAKVTFGTNFESFALSIVLLISLGSVIKYIALLEYDKTISQQCEGESSNLQLNRMLLPSRRLAARK